jgi:hypothetical protein
MLRSALAPIQRGVTRGSHAEFNRLDARRQVGKARAVNLIDGLIKTHYREKDLLDKRVLLRLKQRLAEEE